MKNILIVMRDLRIGSGVVSCIMNYYSNITAQYNISFLLLDDIDSKYKNNVLKNKQNIFYLPKSKIKYSLKGEKFLDNLFEENHFDIIHVNIPGPYGSWILKQAKKHNVKNRIYHCHCPKDTSSLKAKISSNIFTNKCINNANKYIACSSFAGDDIFKNKKYEILLNCIDINKFRYCNNKKVRNFHNISSQEVVIGTVGRMEIEKNPYFIVDLCVCLKEQNILFKFLWVGNGTLKNKIMDYARKKNVLDLIIFAGVQSDITSYYSAMDIFILPSFFEGLGLVLIEAQSNGLICLTSTNVPSDTKITNNIHYLPLDNLKEWANKINELTKKIPSSDERLMLVHEVEKSKYNLKNSEGNLSSIYKSCFKEGDNYE